MVLSVESVVDDILINQFHTLRPMYGCFSCKIVSLSFVKVKKLWLILDKCDFI